MGITTVPQDTFVKPTLDNLIRDRKDTFYKLYEDAKGYIDILNSIISNLRVPKVELQSINFDDLESSLDLYIPEYPEKPEIDFSFPIPPQISDFSEIAPVFSKVLELPELEIDKSEYVSPELDFLLNFLVSNIRGDVSFLDENLETLLFNRERERNNLELELRINQLKQEYEQFGYQIPDGVFLANITLLQREAMAKHLDANRDALLKQIELTHDWKKFVLELFTRLNMELMNFNKFIREYTFNASKTLVDITLASFAEYVKLYNADMEAFKTKSSVYIAQVQNIVDLYTKRISAEVSRIDAITKKYSLESDIFKTILQSQMTKLEAIATKYKVKGDVFNIINTVNMRKAEFEIAGMKTINDLRIEGYKLITSILSQIASGAVASISGSVDARYSFSEDNTPVNIL